MVRLPIYWWSVPNAVHLTLELAKLSACGQCWEGLAMAGKPATLPAGIRLADYLSTGLPARICTPDDISLALEATGRQSKRQRDLPAHALWAESSPGGTKKLLSR